MEVVFASRSMVYLLGEAESSSLFNALCTPCAVYGSWNYRSLMLGSARQHFVSGLFIVRVAPFRRPLGTFRQQLCRQRGIVTAKQNNRAYLPFFPKSTLIVLLMSSALLSQLVFHN